MRYYLLAAAAAVAIATPAVACDGSGYIGIEGGLTFPKDPKIRALINYDDPPVTAMGRTDVGRINLKTGYDVDLIGGYDFGMFRLEAELGYKHAKASNSFDSAFIGAINTPSGNTLTNGDLDNNGKASVLSGMINALVDFDVGGFGAYAGGGIGKARVRELGDVDNAWAWQGIAGVRM